MKVTPTLPKGTRDFGPAELRKRNYIFGIIKSVFEKYGFQPLETPVMENLTTLEGKYGEEGDKLLFRILNSGDFLKDVPQEQLAARASSQVTRFVSEKGLRYDLTIPFARYVVQHQHDITFPFKRYQIQPVWRADRPQKGRYREFYQCDADVIGSDSLLNEVELILIYDEVFKKLGMDVTIKFNNRKLLVGIAEKNKIENQLASFTVAIDKLDKIGTDGVQKELAERNIPADALDAIIKMKESNTTEKLSYLENYFAESATGQKGLEEIKYVFDKTEGLKTLEFDPTLARGLDYYTGTIFEVKVNNAQMGSIGGGGRYDNLTGVFGLPNMPGVGISFGVERIYDVMEELKLFPEIMEKEEKVLFVPRDASSQDFVFGLVQQVRNAGITAEIFLGNVKKQKQFNYAETKNISYIVEVGDMEVSSKVFRMRNAKEKKEVLNDSGNSGFTIEQIIEKLKK